MIMKKLSTYLFLILLSFFINQNSFSKDMATWGPTGSTCKDLKAFLDTEEGKLLVESEIRGFLNGLNLQSYINNKSIRMKVVNYNSTTFALEYLINYCRRNPDGAALMGILDYFESLPEFKD